MRRSGCVGYGEGMKQPFLTLGACLALSFVSACGSNTEASSDGNVKAVPADPAAQVETMKLAIAELMASPEKEVDRVEIQHILIAFAGAPRVKATRLRPDAEILAAELYCRLVDGEDMDELVREYTDDSPPGIYIMNSRLPAPGEFARSQMVAGFGNVGWRLEPGEIGVAAYHPKDSPFGWHIIKRLN